MKLPKKWLCEYVDLNVSNAELIEKMMWRGFECAGVEKELSGVEGVVVGRVLSVVKHENSDHLHVCQVDIGSEVLTIVTGADNVFDGALVPAAVVGSKLDGREMTAVSMRGVMSYGMHTYLGPNQRKFDFNIWSPPVGSLSGAHEPERHLILPTGINTHLFCSAQILIPSTGELLISGGDVGTVSDQRLNDRDVIRDFRKILDTTTRESG